MNSWKGEFLMTNTKKKHGNKMKLMSAIGMLTVSAAMLVSSTFAWFSMNRTVQATSMQVTAKSNNTYLLIGTGDAQDTYAEIQALTPAQTTVALTVAAGDEDVYPSKPLESAEIGSGKLFETGTPVTNYATANVPANWYTAQNNNPAASTDSIKNQTQLTTFTDYVIKKTCYLTLAEGAESANGLTVTPTITAKTGTATDISAVKVLVVTDANNMVTLNSTMTTAQSLHATTDTTLTDTSVVTVDIYIYYDGSEAAVTTNNKADLAGADISLQFDVAVA
jgi:hypothetical protein